MPKFLPGLRSQVLAPAAGEGKAMRVAFSSYYSDLNNAYNLHRRARPWPIERAVVEGYERVIWCFKSVNTIGSDLSRLPFRLREGLNPEAPVVDDHPLYRVLNDQANPIESGPIFRKRLSAQILLSKKGAFVEVTKSNGGSIIRLDLLPPDRTEIVPDDEGNIDHYRLTRKDGGIRNLEPDQVRWFRDPHPTDPYSGVTPLEAAGLSVELDHFARLYNVSFMANDGRPGGILAVRDTKGGTGDLDPRQQDRIEQRFGKGPIEAGKLSVIAGDLSYVDLAAKPRDMQYGQTSKNSKIEILEAFGVSDVVLGYAADRTFANADAELYNYWTRTIPGHADIMLSGLHGDSDRELRGFFDTSTVEVLERAARDRREEARKEVEAGLRSPYSYAVLANYADEIDETPYTRAIYIPSGKTPLPGKEEDAEALGLAVPVEAPPAGTATATQVPPGGQEPPAAPPGAPAPAAVGGGPKPPALPAGSGAGSGSSPSSAARAALDAIVGKAMPAGGGDDPKVLTIGYRLSRKESSADRPVTSDPDLRATDAFEDAITATLTSLSERWIERTIVRIGSPKQRKGTRHFVPEYDRDTRVGTKALDAASAVDEQTWQQEAETATHPILTAAAVAAAIALLSDFDAEPPAGLTMATWAARMVAQTTYEVVTGIGRAVLNQANALIAMVNQADQRGDSIEDIVAAVRDRGESMKSWARGVATQAATATTGGARDAAATEAEAETPGSEVDRIWFSRRDSVVRETHNQRTGCDGQVRGLTEPFLVGSALLMRPGDPYGPLRETANCRCFLRHRMRRSGRWTIAPDGKRLTLKAAVLRDGDGDGWIEDGTTRMRPAPGTLRAALPQEKAIAKGASLIEKYRAESRTWHDQKPAGLVNEHDVAKIFESTFTTRTGMNVQTTIYGDYDSHGDEMDSGVRAWWESRRGGGSSWLVEGDIIDADTKQVIGDFQRQIVFPGNGGEPYVDHLGFGLEPEAQGQGIAGEFNAHAIAWYKELGIKRIDVQAGGSFHQGETGAMNGGYTWGTQGFDYAPPEDRAGQFNRSHLATMMGVAGMPIGDFEQAEWEYLIDSGPGIPADWWDEDNRRWVHKIINEIDPFDPPTPFEIGELGRDRPFIDTETGEWSWFGKALQSRSNWDGAFRLDWLDTYAGAKYLATNRRPLLCAVLMLGSLGADATGSTETKALPHDGDGDGRVYDGTPRERPAPRKITWRRRAQGYVDAEGDYYLERQGRMAGSGTNGWAIYVRTPDEHIGQDEGRSTRYDDRTGDPLVEVDGVYYSHEGDEVSLADAKFAVTKMTGNRLALVGAAAARALPEAQGTSMMNADGKWREGYDAARERFADMPRDQREAYAREVDKQIRGQEFGSDTYRILTGIRAYLTERHQQD